jgi:hypothetical protein
MPGGQNSVNLPNIFNTYWDITQNVKKTLKMQKCTLKKYFKDIFSFFSFEVLT